MPEIELPSRPGIGRRDTAPPQRFIEELLQGLENVRLQRYSENPRLFQIDHLIEQISQY